MSRYTTDELDSIEQARRELNPFVDTYRDADDGHVQFVCTLRHEDGGWNCMFCAGDLFACSVCGGLEGAVTTHCPGRPVHDTEAVYVGRLDFRAGSWVAGPSVHTPALFRLACEKVGVAW